MAEANKTRFRYRRERVDGTINDTIDLKSFERWLRDAEPGDAFFVAQCRWVQCERDGSGAHDLPHVRWVRDVDGVAN